MKILTFLAIPLAFLVFGSPAIAQCSSGSCGSGKAKMVIVAPATVNSQPMVVTGDRLVLQRSKYNGTVTAIVIRGSGQVVRQTAEPRMVSVQSPVMMQRAVRSSGGCST